MPHRNHPMQSSIHHRNLHRTIGFRTIGFWTIGSQDQPVLPHGTALDNMTEVELLRQGRDMTYGLHLCAALGHVF